MLEKKYVMLHKIIVQNKVLVNEIENEKKESRHGKIVDMNKHAEFHKTDKDKTSVE